MRSILRPNTNIRQSTNWKRRCTNLYIETNWDDLRVFLALAREGTLVKTAKALDVSHPTVSRGVQALEHTIGAPIRAPCYLGDQDPALRRVGGVLAEVSTEQWLLVHRDSGPCRGCGR